MRYFKITKADVAAIETAQEVLKDVLRGGPGTAESRLETREAIMGLNAIIPIEIIENSKLPTRPFRGPEPDGVA